MYFFFRSITCTLNTEFTQTDFRMDPRYRLDRDKYNFFVMVTVSTVFFLVLARKAQNCEYSEKLSR